MYNVYNKTTDTEIEQLTQCEHAWERVLARDDIGFFKLAERDALWASSLERAKQVRLKFTKHIVLGMGGSALGGRAMQEALAPDSLETLQFWDNIDAKSFHSELLATDSEKTHWVIVSKSGSTMETLAMANFVAQHLQAQGSSLATCCTVISESKSSALMDWAQKNNISILEIPDDVGGRFSVLSPVGVFPAAILGLDINALREGAQLALGHKTLICDLAAQSLMSFDQEKWITLFWCYSQRLYRLGLWFQQLWAESLAKKVTVQDGNAPRVSSPFVCIGASDQHSILQQVMEGALDKFIWFFRDGESESFGPKLEEDIFCCQQTMVSKGLGDLMAAEVDATQKASSEVGVPSLTLKVDKLDERSVGSLFMGLELVVAVIGEVLQIDTYDQPGVEAGKCLARKILSN